MTDRFPLIANSVTNKIEELAPGDNLNLQNSGIVGATTVTASNFVGDLQGTSTNSYNLISAENILSGTISGSRLSGNYNINVTSSNILNDAANIVTGTISSSRLSGQYPINVTGTATTSYYLTSAENILSGTISAERLSGTYQINVSSASTASDLSPGIYSVDISGNAATATTATNLAGGNITGVNLNISGVSTLSGLTTTGGNFYVGGNLYSPNSSYIGYSSITTADISIGSISKLSATNLYVSGISTVGFLTAENIYSSNSTIGILTATLLKNVSSAEISDLTFDYLRGLQITSLDSINTGIASIGFSTISNAYIGVATVGSLNVLGGVFKGNFEGNLTGTATTAINLYSAANIITGIVSTSRLSGTYNINISGNSVTSNTSSNVIGGIAEVNQLNVSGSSTLNDVTATSYYGDGSNIVGIVTQIKVGTGLTLTSSQLFGKGTVQVGIKTSIGKTIYVSYEGSDSNTGLVESDAKRTIKAAAALAIPGDTIKVFPGTFVENNPITLDKDVSLHGTELRNCIVIPQNSNKDLFYVNDGCHLTNLSFNGPPATNNASIISFKPLSGVATDRFFDAARMIRMNLDYIANETVGYLTSTQYRNPPFTIGISTIRNCKEDIVDIFKAVCYDITRGGNSKSVGAGKSYYTEGGALQHIVGVKTETIDALNYAAGIARAIVNNVTWGSNPVGIATSVTNAVYNNVTGVTTITAVNHGLSKNDAVKIVGLGFTCPSDGGIATLTYPTGSVGYIFNVKNVVGVNTFEVIVGQSTLPHTYVSGGTVQKYQNFQNDYTQVKDLSMQPDPLTGFNDGINGCANVVSAIYSCIGIVTTIINNGLGVLGVGINTTYPGNSGMGSPNPNDPSFSSGVGIINKGPYIRNCTNFIQNSIGLKVDGFNAEPGDKIDNGIQGSMSVDSYTQYNQGGIGVSITNGGYAQLVSIFTICDDIAIYTASGGQCDITNSNNSFGTYGLYSNGVGDNKSKSIFRYTGIANTDAMAEQDTIAISGVGTYRPYSGQVVYFDKLYYSVNSIKITDGGSGYTSEPTVIIDSPTGPNGIKAEAFAVIENGKVVSINLISTGNQYLTTPSVTITGGGGSNASAVATLKPIYYRVNRATLPSSGITTVTLTENLNNTVSAGTTSYFSRMSLQVASTISFEYIGAGNTIESAKPSKGGITKSENEVVKLNGGEVVYTSTDQSGNFRIGDGVVINQLTGTISGRAFSQSLLNTVTPLIISLGR